MTTVYHVQLLLLLNLSQTFLNKRAAVLKRAEKAKHAGAYER